jgi:hypothetical protein
VVFCIGLLAALTFVLVTTAVATVAIWVMLAVRVTAGVRHFVFRLFGVH